MPPTPSTRLAALGLKLPPAPEPKGSYSAAVVDHGRVFISGQIVTEAGSVVHPGRVDGDLSLEEARGLARRATLQALSALAAQVGSIDRVARVLRVGVYVASSEGFHRQHEVANGATDLLIELFGEAGRSSRVSMGVVALPMNAPVEVELLVEIA